MTKYRAKVKSVSEGSMAFEAGIEPGDIIAKINSNIINDELDFRFYLLDDFVNIEVIKKDGSILYVEVEYPDSPTLGIEFESALMGGAKCCANKCIFCFIDQLPQGMRDTLYFKDDDSRLSFLTGNYATLTNISEKEIDKIIKMRLEPINISVHTTNPDLRQFMLKNKRAANIMKYMRKLYDGKIHMNCQIVLLNGINDKKELDRTLYDLSELYPYVTSVSVVPVGITRYRDNLFSLKPFDKQESADVIKQLSKLQKEFKNKLGTNFVYAADEFYVKSDIQIPDSCEYEGYYQIENGVGLLRNLIDEFNDAINDFAPDKPCEVTVLTGEASYDTMCMLAKTAMEKYPIVKIQIHAVKNEFFGGHITVTGLITGSDIVKSLKNVKTYDRIIISDIMLKHQTELFLDDMTVSGLSKETGHNIEVTANDGYSLWNTIIKGEK